MLQLRPLFTSVALKSQFSGIMYSKWIQSWSIMWHVNIASLQWRLGLILRCHFYNVISLAVRSRLCFMFSTDFYWCVFSKFFFLLQCSSQLCIAFCYLVLIQKRHSTSSCENSHSRVRVCSSACRILEADQKRVRGKGKISQEILQRAGGDEPLCCCWFLLNHAMISNSFI